MPEPAPAPPAGRAEQALVAAMAATAVVGFTVVRGPQLALAALVPIALSLLWRPARIPRWIARPAPGILRISLASVFVMRAGLTIYPLLDDERVAAVALISGSVLLPLLAAAVLGTRLWRPFWAAVPLSIALLVVVSFDASPRVWWVQVTEALLGIAYLVVILPRREPPTGVRRTVARATTLLLFVAAAAALAAILAHFLPWAQPHVEEAAATLLNPSFPVAHAGFSANSKLGDIERLALSRTVVLRVWAPSPRKLRARVLTEFDGRTWHAPRPAWVDVPPASASALPEDLASWLAALPGTSFGDGAVASRPEQTRMRVAQAVVVADTLFAPVGVAIARVRGPRLRSNRFGVLEAPADPVGMYALVHAPVAAGGGKGDAEMLAVRDDTDPRLRALADTLAEGDPSPPVKIARTVTHLSRECRYSLDVGPFTSGQPVAEFLFDKKKGYCEYFASAAAILLRLQGVPTRYVTGFSMDASEAVGGHYVVRESDAHAWIEAWIPGRGWVEVDPTPAGDYAAVHAARGGLLARAEEWIRARWAEAALAVRTGELRRLVGLVALVFAMVVLPVLAVAGFRFRRRRRRAPARAPGPGKWDEDPELAGVMARLDSLWARHGHPRPAHRAPLEHLHRVPPGRLPAALQAASADVIACYYDARYGGRAPARETVRGLARLLEDPPS